MEVLQVLGRVGPTQGGEGPQGRGEPRVEHVGVLHDAAAAALRAGLRRLDADQRPGAALHRDAEGAGSQGLVPPVPAHRLQAIARAIGAVPGRDPVAPPDLPRQGPVADGVQPLQGIAPVAVGHVGDLRRRPAVEVGANPFGQGLHVHEPLLHGQRLDRRPALVMVGHGVLVVLRGHQQARRLQGGHHVLAALVPVLAGVGTRPRGHHRVEVDDGDLLQSVAGADLVVVRVVGRRHLHRPRAHLRVRMVVGHDGDRPVHEGQHHLPPDGGLPALVAGMDGDTRVPEHGLGAGGGHNHVGAAVEAGIADVPEPPLGQDLLGLQVGDDAAAPGTPVDHPGAAVDPALLVKPLKSLEDGGDVTVVQGEAAALPVVAAAQLAHLVVDRFTVGLAPGPDALHQALPPEVVAGTALLLVQLLLHLHLRGDPGVVGARQDQRLVPLHALAADDVVVDRVLHGVAHVQLAGDVRRRDGDAPGGAVRVRTGAEPARRLPAPVPAPLAALGVVSLGQFAGHSISEDDFVECCNRVSDKQFNIGGKGASDNPPEPWRGLPDPALRTPIGASILAPPMPCLPALPSRVEAENG